MRSVFGVERCIAAGQAPSQDDAYLLYHEVTRLRESFRKIRSLMLDHRGNLDGLTRASICCIAEEGIYGEHDEDGTQASDKDNL